MSSRRIAVIDMGSNTGRLALYRALGTDAWFLEDEIREVVRLRAGLTEEEGLAPQAIRRGLAVLRLFRRFCDSVDVDMVIPTATSAVRDAANGAAFLKDVKAATGWQLRVLEFEEEARYGAVGVLAEVPMVDGYVLDIGGGSAQLSRIAGTEWQRGVSLPLGALRLHERFLPTDPPSPDEVQALRAHIRAQLETVSWLEPLGPGETLAGLGGSIRNLGYIEHARSAWPLPTLRGVVLEGSRIHDTVEQLLAVPTSRRARIAGLNPDRADILPAGSIVVQEVMAYVGASAIHLSVNGLREGLVVDHIFPAGAPRGEELRQFSVDSLARRYRVRRDHAERVRHLSLRLFDDLQGRHGLDPTHRELLAAAAILHDIGSILGYHDHHKHSQEIVALNGLPGFTARETALVALLTRYHRKGTPTPGVYRRMLLPEDGAALRWMSAMLRMAEYLERGRSGNVEHVEVADWGDQGVQITIHAAGDASVEQWDTERHALPLLEAQLKSRVRMIVS